MQLYVDISDVDDEQFKAVGRVYIVVIGLGGGGAKRTLFLPALP